MSENTKYDVYEDDRISEGHKLKIERSIYIKEYDITDLISRPLEEVQTMLEKSVELEREAFEDIRDATRSWEGKAAHTNLLNMAFKYLATPKTQHTSNQWVKDQHCNFDTISNKVYKMVVRMGHHSVCRTDKIYWDVQWGVYTNSPIKTSNTKIAGQERTFPDKESAEKYVRGRIKAYSRLFQKISPPIPDEYVEAFKLYGQLLPGYTTESMASEQKDVI